MDRIATLVKQHFVRFGQYAQRIGQACRATKKSGPDLRTAVIGQVQAWACRKSHLMLGQQAPPQTPSEPSARPCPTRSTAAPPAAPSATPMRINGINISGPTAKKAKFRAEPIPSPFETAPHSRHSRYSLLTIGYLIGRGSPHQWLVGINPALWSGTSSSSA